MERLAGIVFMLMTLGELAIGVAVLAYPRLLALLIDTHLNVDGLLVARMLGAAVLALGVSWWTARNDPERLSRHAAGFIVYNITVGALFVLAAMGAAQPVLPALVAAAHLAAACLLIAGLLARGVPSAR